MYDGLPQCRHQGAQYRSHCEFRRRSVIDSLFPCLTTVEFPRHDIGVKAGKALLELLNDKPGEKFIEIPSVLKVRASTAA